MPPNINLRDESPLSSMDCNDPLINDTRAARADTEDNDADEVEPIVHHKPGSENESLSCDSASEPEHESDASTPTKNRTRPLQPLRRSLEPQEAELFFTELPDSITIRKRYARDSNLVLEQLADDRFRLQTVPPKTPEGGRGRGRVRQLLTPPTSTHSSPAPSRVPESVSASPTPALKQVPTTPTRRVRSTFQTPPSKIPLGFFRYYSRSSSAPQTILRSGRTPQQEVSYLITNSGFTGGFRERMEKAYPRKRLAKMDPAMPRLGKRKSWEAVSKNIDGGFDIAEDDTSSPAKRARTYRS